MEVKTKFNYKQKVEHVVNGKEGMITAILVSDVVKYLVSWGHDSERYHREIELRKISKKKVGYIPEEKEDA